MHTVGSIQTEALLRLSPLYSREEARSLVRILLEEILHLSRTQLLMASERPLDEGQEGQFWVMPLLVRLISLSLQGC